MIGPRFVLAAVMLAACSHDPPPSTPDPVPVSSVTTSTTTTASAAPSASAAPVASEASLPDKWERVPDIEYVPTPQNVVDKMLDVMKLTKADVLYDLGCGDGRIPITAAKKYGIKAKGFDIDPVRVKESRENVKKNGVENLVTIELKDIFNVDLSPASVVSLYLLPELNVKLIPQLEKLAPGSRIVSHDFDMAGVQPENTWTIMAPHHRKSPDGTYKDREHYVYLWKTPLKKVAPKTK
jgi:SAM-dependent methyltransferase